MGLVASQARMLFLTSYKSDLEFQVQMICQQRTTLAMEVSGIAVMQANTSMKQAENLNAGGQELTPQKEADFKSQNDKIAAMLQRVHSADKVLEMEQKQLETQRDAATTELESVKKVIDKNIEMSFKYFA